MYVCMYVKDFGRVLPCHAMPYAMPCRGGMDGWMDGWMDPCDQTGLIIIYTLLSGSKVRF